MSNDAGTRQFFNPAAPTQSTTPGLGITRLATTVAATKYDLSSFKEMFGKRLRFTTEGTDAIWVSFSSDGVTDVSKAATAGTTVAAGTLAANGVKVTAGAPLDIRLDKVSQKWLHVQADANTPVLSIFPIAPDALRT
jgi:hypothetical protein